jgi:hypothetical protein
MIACQGARARVALSIASAPFPKTTFPTMRILLPTRDVTSAGATTTGRGKRFKFFHGRNFEQVPHETTAARTIFADNTIFEERALRWWNAGITISDFRGFPAYSCAHIAML